jgi:structure-specific endonuclease subunit SLX1
MSPYVYILAINQSTYVGATVDLNRRLRQHNKELKGGAVATTSKVNDNCQWKRICHIAGFPDWQAALQFEWRLKQLTRKLPISNHSSIERRLKALKQLLSLERPTTKAKLYSEWASPPQVVFEGDDNEELAQLYKTIIE